MTAQLADVVEFEDVLYTLAAFDGEGLFEPADHGVRFGMTSTANYRGYQACYAVRDGHLLLTALGDVGLPEAHDGTPPEQLPRIGGVAPTPSDDGTRVPGLAYEGLDLPMRFSGGLLLADGFITDLYVHMGFHPAWKFEHVVELLLDAGRVLRVQDRSGEVAQLRGDITVGRRADPDREHAASWIARSFERDYVRSLGR